MTTTKEQMNQLEQQIHKEHYKPFGYIYKLTSPSNKCYIGQTIQNIKHRWNVYRRLKCIKQPQLS